MKAKILELTISPYQKFTEMKARADEIFLKHVDAFMNPFIPGDALYKQEEEKYKEASNDFLELSNRMFGFMEYKYFCPFLVPSKNDIFRAAKALREISKNIYPERYDPRIDYKRRNRRAWNRVNESMHLELGLKV